jgi:hypothetical protein
MRVIVRASDGRYCSGLVLIGAMESSAAVVARNHGANSSGRSGASKRFPFRDGHMRDLGFTASEHMACVFNLTCHSDVACGQAADVQIT